MTTLSRFIMCLITWYSSDIPLPPNISLAFLAISRAFLAEFFFIIEIISGVALKNFTTTQMFVHSRKSISSIQAKSYLSSSFSLPTLRQAWRPNEMSHIISTNFFCINWLAASGLLNCFLCRLYALDMCKQASAAPKAPQAIPYLALFRQTNGPCTSISSRVRAPRYTENFQNLLWDLSRSGAYSPRAPPSRPWGSYLWWNTSERIYPWSLGWSVDSRSPSSPRWILASRPSPRISPRWSLNQRSVHSWSWIERRNDWKG